MIIDATHLIAGRIATTAAKAVLQGQKVDIVNAEKAVLTGNKKNVFAKYKQRADRGTPHWGPFQPKTPDRFLRRIVRGMLSHTNPRGREAFKRVMCHIGVPKEFEGKETTVIAKASVDKLPNLKYVTIKEITEHLKGQ